MDFARVDPLGVDHLCLALTELALTELIGEDRFSILNYKREITVKRQPLTVL